MIYKNVLQVQILWQFYISVRGNNTR